MAVLLRPLRNADHPPVSLRRFFDDDGLRVAAVRVQEIRRRAVINLQERGLDTPHLVLGFATLRANGARPPKVSLLPVPNVVLAHNFNVRLSTDEPTDLGDGDKESEEVVLLATVALSGIAVRLGRCHSSSSRSR